MAWLEITIDTAAAQVEQVAEELTKRGFSDLVIEDQQEFETFLEENRAYWDYIDDDLQKKLQGLSHIKLYLEDTDAKNLRRVQDYAASAGLPLTVSQLADTNWDESWKENYPPQEIGQKLLVLPYWLAQEYEGERLPVILDPGLTFGTGAHPSTQMVMEAMELLVQPGCKCLDLGSGSGILSIAALRLGADKAVGIDIDGKAEDIARENAAYNGFSAPRFTALTGNVTADHRLMEQLTGENWDIVLVNIVADVIVALAPVLPRLMGTGTRLICSGILDTRLADVTAALSAAGIQVTSIRAKEDWRCVVGQRK